ncbi:unnamed protein product [Schistosoma margrebowiei]|uniref:Uncharacterized protein n=1 Tax=Schistosoma margrebowiei TaxID=48269 RepID=A0A183LPL2_9TREM|nr:unnamed protein product [Schistosoma margrebowiei]
MSTDCFSEYDQLECKSVVSTDVRMRKDNGIVEKQVPNLTNPYNKMKHPGLTPSITAYRWITSQPTLTKSVFSKIESETIAQWLSVSTTDDWLMHIPKCSIGRYDENSVKNWKADYLKQPHSLDQNRFTTLYSTSYEAKHLDEQTKNRPTSANRRNKPQPSRSLLREDAINHSEELRKEPDHRDEDPKRRGQTGQHRE